MKALLSDYNAVPKKTLDDMLDFHVRFEHIHPFQDGNGRVGRLIMFKECLKYNIVPFIIEENLKLFYYRGLKEWYNEKGYLTDTCLTAQDKYKAYLDYFRIPYEKLTRAAVPHLRTASTVPAILHNMAHILGNSLYKSLLKVVLIPLYQMSSFAHAAEIIESMNMTVQPVHCFHVVGRLLHRYREFKRLSLRSSEVPLFLRQMSLKSVQAPLYGRFMHLAAIAGHLVGFYNFNRSNFRISFSQI